MELELQVIDIGLKQEQKLNRQFTQTLTYCHAHSNAHAAHPHSVVNSWSLTFDNRPFFLSNAHDSRPLIVNLKRFVWDDYVFE